MTSGGRFDFDDGGTYCGGWEEGKAHGYGVCTGPKGQGEFSGSYHCGFEVCGVYKWTTGSSYKGQWTQGKRHGLGVENKGRWLYQGEWTQGFKGRYGIRMSSSTGAKYEGTWTTGLQDGYGVETYADGGTYQGQWLRGIRHGYGVRQSVPYGLATLSRQKIGRDSLTSLRSESEDDVIVKERDRKMAEVRGGFVLTAARSTSETRQSARKFLWFKGKHEKRANSAEPTSPTKSGPRSSLRRAFEGLRLRKQRSEELNVNGFNASPTSTTSTTERRYTSSTGSGRSWRRRKQDDDATIKSNASSYASSSLRYSPISAAASESCASFAQDETTDLNAVETYAGEWKNDRRSGFGVSERTDGLKYEGEWDNNKRNGYGATTFPDGSKEEGRYKLDVLVSWGRKNKLMMLRAGKMREQVDNAIVAAKRASQIAIQKSDIAVMRMTSAQAKAEAAMQIALKAQSDAEKAKNKAMEFAPEFMAEIAKKDNAALAASAAASSLQHHLPIHLSSKPNFHSYDTNQAIPDVQSSFVSQFTDHYNPQHQLHNAKAFMSRMAKNVSDVIESSRGDEPVKSPLPTIGNVLLSVGLDTSLYKSLATKPRSTINTNTVNASNIQPSLQMPQQQHQMPQQQEQMQQQQQQLMQQQQMPQQQQLMQQQQKPQLMQQKPQLQQQLMQQQQQQQQQQPQLQQQQPQLQQQQKTQPQQLQRPQQLLQHQQQLSDRFLQQTDNPQQQTTKQKKNLDIEQQKQQHLLATNNSTDGNTSANVARILIDKNKRLSELLDQSVLDDHFDQYQTWDETTSSKVSKTTATRLESQQQHLQQQQPTPTTNKYNYQHNDSSSGSRNNSRHQPTQSEMSSFSYDRTRQHYQQQQQQQYNRNHSNNYYNNPISNPISPVIFERRQTLPAGQLKQQLKLSTANVTTSQQKQQPTSTSTTTTTTRLKSAKEALGSMPDVSKRLKSSGAASDPPAIPREEVHYMSVRRREEIRIMREEEERRRQQELVLSFAEFKNWCQQRQLVVFVIALNLGLLVMFYNMLSR